MNKAITEMLRCAWTYYDHRGELVYAWGGKTFLRGMPLYDLDCPGRGNIDCSTFVILALLGIDFPSSPYQTKVPGSILSLQSAWTDSTLISRMKQDEMANHANGLAKYYYESGRTFDTSDKAQPGDLVFFPGPEAWHDIMNEKEIFMGIIHVGIVTAKHGFMLHATGTHARERNLADPEPVRLSPIDERQPCLFARPY